MVLRAISVLSILGLVIFSGCCGCRTFGPEPPKFKVCNPGRLVDELAWFYADLQDNIFGVDFYADMNQELGYSPYH